MKGDALNRWRYWSPARNNYTQIWKPCKVSHVLLSTNHTHLSRLLCVQIIDIEETSMSMVQIMHVLRDYSLFLCRGAAWEDFSTYHHKGVSSGWCKAISTVGSVDISKLQRSPIWWTVGRGKIYSSGRCQTSSCTQQWNRRSDTCRAWSVRDQ